MAEQRKCNCPRCSLQGITGPLVLITLGVLFLIDKFGVGYGFWTLWPVLLIVVGVGKLIQALAPATNHIET